MWPPSPPPHTLSSPLPSPACRSPAGEDVVPTFTTSNERMLLLLSGGASGMLRVEDAERLQVSWEGAVAGWSWEAWPRRAPGSMPARCWYQSPCPTAATATAAGL